MLFFLHLMVLRLLTALIFMYGTEEFPDITDTLTEPIQLVYKNVKDGIADLNKAYVDIVNDITPEPTRVIDRSMRDVNLLIEQN